MVSKNELAQIVIFGLDLGHGETSLAWIEGCENIKNDVKMVFQPPSDITAIAYLEQGVIVWGNAARSYANNSKGNLLFDIGFKCKPGSELDKKTTDFAVAVFKKAVSTCKLEEKQKNIKLFIGCPSGWDEYEREEYQNIFIDAGLENVTIISESEAAYAYYFGILKNQPNYEDKIDLKTIKKPPLVLDFGSSTLDATVEKIIGEPITTGISLGASLIDRAILEYILTHSNDEQYINEFPYIDVKRCIADLSVSFQSNPSAYAQALLFCRDAKEKYWNGRKRNPDNIEGKVIEAQTVTGITLPIFINDQLMRKFLTEPLVKLISNLEDSLKHELADYSWLECLERFLEYDLKFLLEEESLCLEDIGIIVFTGGASLMPPVWEVTKKYFPHLDKQAIKYDTEPTLCVAKGLATKGRMKTRNFEFNTEINNCCQDEHKGLLAIVKKHYTIDKMSRLIGCGKFAEIVKSNLERWRLGTIEKASSIPAYIYSQYDNWNNSKEFKDFIKTELLKIEDLIRKDVNKLLYPIVQKYFGSDIHIDFLPNSIMTKNIYELMYEQQKQYYPNLDYDIYNEFRRLHVADDIYEYSALPEFHQKMAKFLVEHYEETWKTHLEKICGVLKDRPAFLGLRTGQLRPSDIEFMSSSLQRLENEMILEEGKEEFEKFLEVITIPIYIALTTEVKKTINQSEYILAFLPEE